MIVISVFRGLVFKCNGIISQDEDGGHNSLQDEQRDVTDCSAWDSGAGGPSACARSDTDIKPEDRMFRPAG